MSGECRRVLLVKPGDVLLVGNVGIPHDLVMLREAGQALDALGIRAVFFAEDIDMTRVTP